MKATHTRATYLEKPLTWDVQPRVLFIYDPTRESLSHVREFLGNRNCINIAANNDDGLKTLRATPFGYDMVVLNIAPPRQGHTLEEDHHTNEYFLNQINKLGHLSHVPVVVVSDEPEIHAAASKRPYTTVCPRNVTVQGLYDAANQLMQNKGERAKSRVM